MLIAKIRSLSSHSVARNSLALIILQVVNMLAPLVVLPLLSRTLGLEGFGMVMLAFSASAVLLIITDFGFNLSATYRVAKNRENTQYLNRMIGSVYVLKVLILTMLALVGAPIYFTIGSNLINSGLMLSIVLNVLIQSFFPAWFFQGIEKMKNIVYAMFIARLMYVASVYVLVTSEATASDVIILHAISSIFSVLVAIALIYKHGYQIRCGNAKSLIELFKESFQFFLSRAAVSIYTSASTFVVGSFSGASQAALYSASEKLYAASQSFTGPVSQALFPYLAKTRNTKTFFYALVLLGIPLTLGCFILWLFAEDILVLIFGPEFSSAAPIFSVFIVITVVNFFAVNFGYPAFATINKISVANYTVIAGGTIQLTAIGFLYYSNNISALTIAISVLMTELFVMCSRMFLYYMFKNRDEK